MGIGIIAAGHYLPEERITNDYFVSRNPFKKYCKGEGYRVKAVEETVLTEERILEVTGIRERRRAREDQKPQHLGKNAIANCLKKVGLSVNDLEGIIGSTSTKEENVGCMALEIRELLGAEEDRCMNVHDIYAACAGFPIALKIAENSSMLSGGKYLAVCAETLTKIMDYNDVNSTLFGDGAGCALVGNVGEGKGIVGCWTKSDPFRGNLGHIFSDENRKLRMPNGREVMKEAVRGMGRGIQEVCVQAGWEKKDLDLLIAHQANIRIIDALREKQGLSKEQVYVNIDKYGNMSSASCAVAFSEAIDEGLIKDGSRVVIAAFGAGFIISAIGIQL